MNTQELFTAIEAALAQVEAQLTTSVGASSLCTLEKSNGVTHAMKYLEGQQQAYRGALRRWHNREDITPLLHYLREEQINNETMRNGRLGGSPQWQAYLEGNLAALAQLQALLNPSTGAES